MIYIYIYIYITKYIYIHGYMDNRITVEKKEVLVTQKYSQTN